MIPFSFFMARMTQGTPRASGDDPTFKNYEIRIGYITSDLQESIRRAEDRALTTGRGVSENAINGQYKRQREVIKDMASASKQIGKVDLHYSAKDAEPYIFATIAGGQIIPIDKIVMDKIGIL